jgi:hypothetical protein
MQMSAWTVAPPNNSTALSRVAQKRSDVPAILKFTDESYKNKGRRVRLAPALTFRISIIEKKDGARNLATPITQWTNKNSPNKD